MLPAGTPLLTLALNFASGLIYDFAVTRRERRRVRGMLERYVSREVARELIDHPKQFQQVLGGVVRPITVLFSDIRSFTKLCANTEPHALVHQLNEYLTAMVECVFAHRGTLDKFIGDAVMVVWGDIRSEGPEGDVALAVQCARAMQAALARLNDRWAEEGRLPLEIGIALNHGPGVVGHIGSPHRMEITVMGNVVNVCWRLQECTKQHRGHILIGEEMLPLLGSEFTGERLGEVLVGETLHAGYARLMARGKNA
jgi:adenylate cyclase